MDGLEEIIGEFLVESHENLDQLDRDLIALERDPSSTALLASVFRTIHTIKGTSGFLAFSVLESVTHVGESLLARLRDGEIALTPGLTSLLLEVVDAVRSLLTSIEHSGNEGSETYDDLVARLSAVLDGQQPAEPAAAAPVADAVEGIVQATVEAVEVTDAPVTPVTPVNPEPVVPVAPVLEVVPQLEPAAAEAVVQAPVEEDHGEGRRSVADSTIRVDVALLDSLMNMVGELVLTRNQMQQRVATREDVELARTTHRLNLVAGELQEGVMKMRLQQIDTLWSKLPRVVRDLSMQLGKTVDLVLHGRETELDKTILEAVRDPLTHLVRNSIDHGIESPADREAAGKPATGTLSMRAFHEGGQVNIEIVDDGAGIDPVKLRDKAVAKGLMDRETASRLNDKESVNLIFTPGFSTAEGVTNVSGRGVGMDVVRTNIERIGGAIDLTSEPGRGTTVRIRIPLTLAIIPALVVAAASNRFAIPQANLLELVRLDATQAATAIETVHGSPVYRLRGRLLPLVDLREQLDLPDVERETTYIVVLKADNQQYGLVVDDILDTEEIVVKPLGHHLRNLPGASAAPERSGQRARQAVDTETVYAGATIMGDGAVALILDATALARRAGMSPESELGAGTVTGAETGEAAASILLVELGDGRRAAIEVSAVDRLEEIERGRVERAGHHEVVQYRDQILPLVRLDHVLHGDGGHPGLSTLQVVVCRQGEQRAGVVVAAILDIVETTLDTRTPLDSTGGAGSAVVSGHVTELVDISQVFAGLPSADRLARTA
ncbi:chemotaxis protein CheA [Nocardioides KLBMP 9356]|uniref:histidine kinase n=1 Tax=Nocardioides potassii TaxID=2911371 RepID=A0ABS9HB56_9ACTN|nr:chemotaxis protein CheA [Nocardioides potassii]MCF6378412.1 chemotaxis protein CheA [Nocardioides potassii]